MKSSVCFGRLIQLELRLANESNLPSSASCRKSAKTDVFSQSGKMEFDILLLLEGFGLLGTRQQVLGIDVILFNQVLKTWMVYVVLVLRLESTHARSKRMNLYCRVRATCRRQVLAAALRTTRFTNTRNGCVPL